MEEVYRAFNAIYGKIGTAAASQEVILSLRKSKWLGLPCLLYGMEVCRLNKTELRSLNLTVTRVLKKRFSFILNGIY